MSAARRIRDWRQRRNRPAHVVINGLTVPATDWWATAPIREELYDGSYEHIERLILDETLRREDRYMELGAGAGIVALCACQRVEPANVVAYEADARMVAVARAIGRLNGYELNVVHATLGERDGETDFHLASDFWGSSLAPTDGSTRVRVPVRSFADELARHRPSYLAVDIEGGEIDLLGGRRLPEHVRAICLETHEAVTGTAAIERLLDSLADDGFTVDRQRSRLYAYFLHRAPR